MNIKIYNCFHDHGSKPESKYLSNIRLSLLCGANVKWRGTDSISCDLRDNTGDNISEENEEYSELTGYYWIWKNDTADVVGIEHYRRHFLQKLNIENDKVQTSDLLTDKDICNILKTNDFIIPFHDSLFDINVYDLYKICFNDFVDDIVKNMKRYFVDNNLTNYLDRYYNYMSHNYLIRGNMSKVKISNESILRYLSALMPSILNVSQLHPRDSVLEQLKKSLWVSEGWGTVYVYKIAGDSLVYDHMDIIE